jgi:uncharacterized protein YbjQ (UPF0145 family)
MQARARLIKAAEDQKGDPVLALRFETSELRDTGMEICAYGTAVKIRKLP